MKKQQVKELTIHWLETQRGHGAFEGEIEENMNFHECTDEELEWYFVEWYFPHIEEHLNSDDLQELKEVKESINQ